MKKKSKIRLFLHQYFEKKCVECCKIQRNTEKTPKLFKVYAKIEFWLRGVTKAPLGRYPLNTPYGETIYHIPFWKDECGHPKGSYVGSITDNIDEKLDVYIYSSYVGQQLQICIRYGKEGSQYYSPGNLINILQYGRGDPIYQLAITVIEEMGVISYNRFS